MTINSRQHIDRDLKDLKRQLITLAALAKDSINRAVWALVERDKDVATSVIEKDDEMDDLTREIDDGCLTFIARYQPMGEDLRSALSIMHMAIDLERIGDYGDNIAAVALDIFMEKPIKPLVDIPRMACMFSGMIDLCIESFDTCDTQKSFSIFPMDDRIDDLEEQILRELLFIMMSDTRNIEQSTKLLSVARTLERAGDRVTNLAERVIYMCTGETVRSSRYRRPLKKEDTSEF